MRSDEEAPNGIEWRDDGEREIGREIDKGKENKVERRGKRGERQQLRNRNIAGVCV